MRSIEEEDNGRLACSPIRTRPVLEPCRAELQQRSLQLKTHKLYAIQDEPVKIVVETGSERAMADKSCTSDARRISSGADVNIPAVTSSASSHLDEDRIHSQACSSQAPIQTPCTSYEGDTHADDARMSGCSSSERTTHTTNSSTNRTTQVYSNPTMNAAPNMNRDPLSDRLAIAETNNSREMKAFKRVLRSPELRGPFQVFLEAQFCAENLNFYVVVEDFRNMQFNNIQTQEEREAFAKHIYERHFAPNSVEPVNVDNSTSKRIKEIMAEKTFPRWTFDLAQYQIFHLLKYDCWPRFLRAGGIQPDFTDEELAEEDERQHRLDMGEDLPPELIFPRPRARTEAGDAPSTSSNLNVSLDSKPAAEHDKRRSLFLQGLDRFSRRFRREHGDSSFLTSPAMRRTSRNDREEDPRRSYSSEEYPVPQIGRNVIGSAGTKRRLLFQSTGKQISMPIEMSSPLPTRHNTRLEPKVCRLISGEDCKTENIELNDPTISVRNWTQLMAGTLGMDKKAVEVVDAETGSTIDPARQAVDALQSRSVRIVPVVTFCVEILPPNFSFKNPSSTPTKTIMVRARHSLSAGAVLRPLLGKFALEFGAVVIVFCGTLEAVRGSVCVGNIGPRTLTVMTQPQFTVLTERTTGGKKDFPQQRDPIAMSPNLTIDHNLQFHQHGDVSFCELPTEAERARSSKDHALNLFKFMRKASQAVSKGDEKIKAARRKSVGPSASPAGVYCGEEVPIAAPDSHKEQKINRLSIFKSFHKRDKSASSDEMEKERVPARESPRPVPRSATIGREAVPQSPQSVHGTNPAPVPVRPAPTPRSPTVTRATATVTPAHTPICTQTSNGDAPRTPAIFASRICGDEEDDAQKERGWQTAAYV